MVVPTYIYSVHNGYVNTGSEMPPLQRVHVNCIDRHEPPNKQCSKSLIWSAMLYAELAAPTVCHLEFMRN